MRQRVRSWITLPRLTAPTPWDALSWPFLDGVGAYACLRNEIPELTGWYRFTVSISDVRAPGGAAVRVVWTGYGGLAYEALRQVAGEVKAGDPLAPVSVLVPGNLCGVIARRNLAGGVAGRPGVAGLSVLTVDRLAERVAASGLTGAGRRPATSPVVAAAWRRALAEEAGVFGPVAAHPATVQALAAAHRELREVDEAALERIAGCW